MALGVEAKRLVADRLLPEIRRGQCILFVGAGLSYEAGLPSTNDLARRLWQTLSEQERPKAYSLSEAAETYLDLHTKQDLVELVKEALALPKGEALDTTTFDLIAHISHLSKTIITTNWDTLIEEAINKAIGVRPTVVIRDIDIGQLPGAEHVVYKIHGSWDAPETFVITDRDYRLRYRELFDPRSLVMANVRALLTNKVIIYVGYSLRDEYFDELLRQIRYALTYNRTGEFMGRTSYLVTPEAPDREARRRLKGLRIRWVEARARDFFTFVFRETAEFVNRQEELQMIRSLKEPCVEICGNAGMGKTRLLEELAIKYRYTDNWPDVFHIDLREGDPLDLIKGQDRDVREVKDLSQRRGLLIAMDSLDRAADLDKAIEFIPRILNPEIRTQRVIWATRYSVSDRLALAVKIRTSIYPLSPMLTTYVAQMVRTHVELIGGVKWAEKD